MLCKLLNGNIVFERSAVGLQIYRVSYDPSLRRAVPTSGVSTFVHIVHGVAWNGCI